MFIPANVLKIFVKPSYVFIFHFLCFFNRLCIILYYYMSRMVQCFLMLLGYFF